MSALLFLAGALSLAASARAADQLPSQGGQNGNWRPVYQRHASGWWDKGGHDFKRDRRFPQFTTPQVNSGWFQRPYPYHLDYYKMKWGGSYAPYFGNLYGPPQVVTAPPYFGPYYGNWGMGDGGVPANGGFPGGGVPYGSMPQEEGPLMVAPPGGQVVSPNTGIAPQGARVETLPAQ